MNPFPCSTKINGEPCPNAAAFVFRSATKTELVCDDCAAEYRRNSTRMAVPRNPTAPIALLELLPAREALKMEADRLQRKTEHYLAALRVRTEERELLDRAVYWCDATALCVGFLLFWVGQPIVALFAAAVCSVGFYGLARWWIWRYMTKPQLAALNSVDPEVQ